MCDCALCLDKKSTPKELLLKRKALGKDLRRATGTISKSQRVLDQIEQTYSPKAKEPGSVRLELWDSYFSLGSALLQKNKTAEAIKAILNGLEAQGFILTPHPPRADVKSQRLELRIKQWGMPNEFTVHAFRCCSRPIRDFPPTYRRLPGGIWRLPIPWFLVRTRRSWTHTRGLDRDSWSEKSSLRRHCISSNMIPMASSLPACK